MTKIHKIRIYVRGNGNGWNEVDIGTGTLEISSNGEIERQSIDGISTDKLQMFREKQTLLIEIDEEGEEKKTEE